MPSFGILPKAEQDVSMPVAHPVLLFWHHPGDHTALYSVITWDSATLMQNDAGIDAICIIPKLAE